MDDLSVITMLIISGFQNLIRPKLYSAAERGKMDEVDAAMKKGADVHWKNQSDSGK